MLYVRHDANTRAKSERKVREQDYAVLVCVHVLPEFQGMLGAYEAMSDIVAAEQYCIWNCIGYLGTMIVLN
jgi:hypothetical protein